MKRTVAAAILALLTLAAPAHAQWTKEQLWEASQLNPKNQPLPPPPISTLHGEIKICRRPGIESFSDRKQIVITRGIRFDQHSERDREAPDSYVEIDAEVRIAASQKCTEGVRAHLADGSALLLPIQTPLNVSGPPFPSPKAELVATITNGFLQ
jgi:hypothetical protein